MPKRNRHREIQRAGKAAGHQEGNRAPSPSAHPPRAVGRIGTADDARSLAERLLRGAPWPVAVISISSTASEPYVDAQALKAEVGDLAEVVVIPTNEITWAFSDVMPHMTQVYGGAARVYPVDRGWQSDPYKSPLRFAWSRADSARVVEALARDVARFALQAGSAHSTSAADGAVQRSGTVEGVAGESRAIVKLDDGGYATIWAEMTLVGVLIDQIARRGQAVCGSLDETRRLDVRAQLRPAHDALADYAPNANVLARVASVGPDQVTLELYPGATSAVPKALITDNPMDHLEDLFTEGEVIIALLDSIQLGSDTVSASLRLDVVDEELGWTAPPAVLSGGPPWLLFPPVAAASAAPPPGLDGGALLRDVTGPEPLVERIMPAVNDGPPPLARSTPGIRVATQSSDHAAGLQEIESLRAELRQLERKLNEVTRDRDALRTRLRTSGSQRRKAERAVRDGAPRDVHTSELFVDPEEQFRFEVLVEWASRIPAGQKEERPLRPYAVGPDFLSSIDRTHGAERSKVVSVAVEVLTGLAAELDSRELHPLRVDVSGGSPPVRRGDGATCMRVALQRNSPAARRMHFWQNGEHVEFSRVVSHDDFRP
ncbi:hypothetical protein ICW40_05735 [Actinotalea ferrariae]|uniref:hypothetical protein n=1 Tax=Actinotalea ferrariae TaxID=1386098 RepID=UPI001C8B4912|nr:hypothetical protein [Actinotalea ferrariae]MBX9244307.1 hypothetical protein [Actinotalea ferrariae]